MEYPAANCGGRGGVGFSLANSAVIPRRITQTVTVPAGVGNYYFGDLFRHLFGNLATANRPEIYRRRNCSNSHFNESAIRIADRDGNGRSPQFTGDFRGVGGDRGGGDVIFELRLTGLELG